MLEFEFITAKDFRDSLTADYSEMRRCFDAEGWKSAHVLAGSIVEAMLLDYLIATPNPGRGGKDPLKMDLADVIAACRAESVLVERTADLCSVIRSYRNLIHPGRSIRLGEAQPDRTSATIATTPVEMITAEIAIKRRAAVGLTAEQLLSKIQGDENSLSILTHLLAEVDTKQILARPSSLLKRWCHSEERGICFSQWFDFVEQQIPRPARDDTG